MDLAFWRDFSILILVLFGFFFLVGSCLVLFLLLRFTNKARRVGGLRLQEAQARVDSVQQRVKSATGVLSRPMVAVAAFQAGVKAFFRALFRTKL